MLLKQACSALTAWHPCQHLSLIFSGSRQRTTYSCSEPSYTSSLWVGWALGAKGDQRELKSSATPLGLPCSSQTNLSMARRSRGKVSRRRTSRALPSLWSITSCNLMRTTALEAGNCRMKKTSNIIKPFAELTEKARNTWKNHQQPSKTQVSERRALAWGRTVIVTFLL